MHRTKGRRAHGSGSADLRATAKLALPFPGTSRAEEKVIGQPVAAATERWDERIARQIEAMAGFGLPVRHIACIAGVSEGALREHYAGEMELGVAKANAKVIEALFRKAMGDGPGATAAAIFWAKTRCGWRRWPTSGWACRCPMTRWPRPPPPTITSCWRRGAMARCRRVWRASF